MKVCVYGAGAVGGHLAVRLANAGADVTVVARGPHGAAIRANGLTLVHGDERITTRPPCVEDPASLPPQDVVVVTVKGPSLGAVSPRLPALLAPDARVVFAMNGIPWWFGDDFRVALPEALRERLDPGGRLARTLDPAQVVGCAIYSGNVVDTPGIVRSTTPRRNRMILGRPDGRSDPHVDAFAALGRAAGFEAEVTAEIRAAIWIKMQIIVGVSPITALTGATIGAVVDDPALRAVAAAALRETRTLGVALGFAVPADEDTRLDQYRGAPIKPSMLQDVEARRPLEVDNGILAFCDIARTLGHAVPTLDTVGALIAARARTLAA
jgi:2-dehydropantoate 2-reductase